jgi:hypothetical protein
MGEIQLKDKIKNLRDLGKTYSEIKKELNCSKSTISYHLSEIQKDKVTKRNKKRMDENPVIKKVENFKKKERSLYLKSRDFQRRINGHLKNAQDFNFSYHDVIQKIGETPKCYISGLPIDLNDGKTFQFDHIIPATKGGLNTLDNLGITRAEINKIKNDLMFDELLDYCKIILENNGYEVSLKNK